jgi:hypothetical protein
MEAITINITHQDSMSWVLDPNKAVLDRLSRLLLR